MATSGPWRAAAVQEFAQAARALSSFAEIQQFMEETSQRLGFDYFAITHYVSDPLAANVVNIGTFPEEWMMTAQRRGYWKDSPLAAACRGSVAPFLWSELPRKMQLTARHCEILNAAQECGIGEAFTIPANVQDGTCGDVTFAMKGAQSAACEPSGDAIPRMPGL
ncbi:MAG: autoinducer binding domain-containing protein [Hyphomonadaceae bacterium]